MYGYYTTMGDLLDQPINIAIATTGTATLKNRAREEIEKINARYFRNIAQNLTPNDLEALASVGSAWVDEIRAMMFTIGIPQGSEYYNKFVEKWQTETWQPFINAVINDKKFRIPDGYDAYANIAQQNAARENATTAVVRAGLESTTMAQQYVAPQSFFTTKNMLIVFAFVAAAGLGYYFIRVRK